MTAEAQDAHGLLVHMNDLHQATPYVMSSAGNINLLAPKSSQKNGLTKYLMGSVAFQYLLRKVVIVDSYVDQAPALVSCH